MFHLWVAGTVTLVCALLSSTPLRAQITVDGSLNMRPPQTLTGPYYKIGADLGQIRGRNLFHSFGQFNIRTFLDDNRQVTETATFTGPGSITNILSRVTGGSPSWIDGKLRSEILGANFFLLNPRGVMFGSNASLDVSGSFHVSTADFIRLADGGVFNASLGKQSVLTMAEPTAFGFLASNPAGITAQRSTLSVPAGQTLSLVGGDVSITGATLNAPSGRIAITSVSSPGKIGFNAETQALLDPGGFPRLGRIDLAQAARLDTSGFSGGGTIVIRGGRLIATGGSSALGINASNDNGPQVGIDARVTQDLVLDNSAFQTANARGFTGRGGDIALSAATLTLLNGGFVESFSFGAGPGGNVNLGAATLTLDGSQVASFSVGAGGGPGGTINLNATASLSILGDVIAVLSRTTSSGDGGAIMLSAPVLSVNGAGVLARSRGPGRGGNIIVDAGALTLTGGGGLEASAQGAGQGGIVSVKADSISIVGSDNLGTRSGILTIGSTGAAGRVTLAAPTVTIDGGAVGSRTTGSGTTGDVVMEVAQAFLKGGAFIFNSGIGSGAGPVGNVKITASQAVTMADVRTLLFTSTEGPGELGRVVITAPTLSVDGAKIGVPSIESERPGDVVIDVGKLSLTGGAGIVPATLGAGRGGDVTIKASESVSISGQDSEGNRTSVSTLTIGSGDAGRVEISTPSLTVDAGFITADTHGSGRAGDIILNVGRLVLTGEADVGSSATRLTDIPRFPPPAVTGPGGTVTINASESVVLAGRDTFIDAATNNAAPGGRISISTPSFTASDASAVFASTVGAGRAGDIVVNVGRLTLTGGSIIDSTTAAAGAGGTVMVTARDLVLLTGRDPVTGRSSRLSTNAQSTGRGGDVILRASKILLTDGGQLTAKSTDVADAGSITIEAGRSFRSFNGSVTTEALQGEGGNILLTAGRLLQLVGTQMTTSVKSGIGGGGNISIDPRFVVLDHSQLSANAFGGPGGSVRIVSDVFLTSHSVLSASSALGVSGVIDVQAPITDVSGTLARLPEAVFQAAALLRAACQVRLAEGRTSSFVLGGRGGLAIEPGGLLGSPLLDDPVEASPAARPLSFSPLSFGSACR